MDIHYLDINGYKLFGDTPLILKTGSIDIQKNFTLTR